MRLHADCSLIGSPLYREIPASRTVVKLIVVLFLQCFCLNKSIQNKLFNGFTACVEFWALRNWRLSASWGFPWALSTITSVRYRGASGEFRGGLNWASIYRRALATRTADEKIPSLNSQFHSFQKFINLFFSFAWKVSVIDIFIAALGRILQDIKGSYLIHDQIQIWIVA